MDHINHNGVNGEAGGDQQYSNVANGNASRDVAAVVTTSNGAQSNQATLNLNPQDDVFQSTNDEFNPEPFDGLERQQFHETEAVVQTFMVAASRRELALGDTVDESTQTVEAVFSNLPPPALESPTDLETNKVISRFLDLMGKDVEQRYGPELDEMVALVHSRILRRAGLNNRLSLTFDVFKNVAKQLFDGSQITWGRIVALLCFGYRLAVVLVGDGLPDFVRKIIYLVARFIVEERIGNWIYRQGGWVQALTSENSRLWTVMGYGYWSVQLVSAAILIWSWASKR